MRMFPLSFRLLVLCMLVLCWMAVMVSRRMMSMVVFVVLGRLRSSFVLLVVADCLGRRRRLVR